jgi:hypothetical protein
MAREICLSLPVGKLEETGQRYLINVIRILRYINYRKKNPSSWEDKRENL